MNNYYDKISLLMKDFLKNKYWNNFTNSDVFYFAKNSKKIVSSFISNFYGDSFGIQIYNNKDGLNYLSDIFSEEDEEINTIKEFECDALCIIYSDLDALNEDEKAYLESKKVKIKKENNLILYRFESGYGRRFANKKEEKQALEFLEVLSDVIHNDFEVLVANFKEYLSAIVTLLPDYSYHLVFDELPYLETKVKNQEANLDILKMLKEMNKTDDTCYISILYSPIVLREDNVRPALVYLSFSNSGVQAMHYLTCDKSLYSEEFFNILLTAFDEHGIPSEIVVNNRMFKSYIYSTFKKLNVAVTISVDSEIDDQIVSSFAHVFNYDFEIKDEKEKVVEVLQGVCDVVNTLSQNVDTDDEEFEDDDDLGPKYVS